MIGSRLLPVFCLALLPVLAACGATDPYIYKPKEFDRNDKSFNKPLTDRTEVTICYNGVGTSDGHVLAMAEAECGRFDKRAEPRGEGFGACPLMVPIEARFVCLPSAGAAAGGSAEAVAADAAERTGPGSAEVPPVYSGEPQPDDGASGGVIPGLGAGTYGTP